MRILLAEDHDEVAKISLRLLESQFGHSVQRAASGQETLDLAKEWQPDLILVDIGLPDMDGFQVAQQLRADAAFHDTLLVALTGYSGSSDRDRAYAAGFDAHYAKPMEFGDLEKVRRRTTQ